MVRDNWKKLFSGKRKLVSIPAIPLIAVIAWPFILASALSYLVIKKVPNKKAKIGLVTFLAIMGLGSAPQYYANTFHASIAQPKAIESSVMGAQTEAVTVPTSVPTLQPTEAPTNTPTPTETPKPTIYIAPTKATVHYLAPTTAPTQYVAPTALQSQTSGLSNDNYYTNSEGNEVHSPASTTDNSVPAGATAQCADGTYSFSESHRGTCSHHGGVSSWL